MSEKYTFKERAEGLQEVPTVKLELTVRDRCFLKYEIIQIGSQQFLICTRPIKNDDGTFTYTIRPIDCDNTSSLVGDALPEL